MSCYEGLERENTKKITHFMNAEYKIQMNFVLNFYIINILQQSNENYMYLHLNNCYNWI